MIIFFFLHLRNASGPKIGANTPAITIPISKSFILLDTTSEDEVPKYTISLIVVPVKLCLYHQRENG